MCGSELARVNASGVHCMLNGEWRNTCVVDWESSPELMEMRGGFQGSGFRLSKKPASDDSSSSDLDIPVTRAETIPGSGKDFYQFPNGNADVPECNSSKFKDNPQTGRWTRRMDTDGEAETRGSQQGDETPLPTRKSLPYGQWSRPVVARNTQGSAVATPPKVPGGHAGLSLAV